MIKGFDKKKKDCGFEGSFLEIYFLRRKTKKEERYERDEE